MTLQSRWAVILCKFSDDQSATQPLTHYERLFTGAGTGSLNMVDFFRDMSHGKLDVSGSQVFGWYTLNQSKSDFVGNQYDANGNLITPPPGKYNRSGLFALCQQAAIDNGALLDPFDGVVVSMNGEVGLWGVTGGMKAFCDSNSLSPSPLGQEMGHGYGLKHSRQDGSVADYMDRWDVMTVYDRAFMARHKEWGRVGPGLNAANMAGRGWLDESRVWQTDNNESVDTVVTLRPLQHRDLPGYLAARFGEYLIEFRVKERWDAAIPKPAVLIHRFEDNHSYLMSDNDGQQALDVNSSFVRAIEIPGVLSAATSITVLEIDADQKFAKIRLHRHNSVVHYVIPEERPYRNPGIAWAVIANEKLYRISHRSPLLKTLEHLALYESSEAISSVQLQTAVRVEALSAIVALAQRQIQTLQAFGQPAPPQETKAGLED